MSVVTGRRLGPYVIEASLVAGGMGEVYRGRDTRLDRTVAVKVLTGALAADSESRQRFEPPFQTRLATGTNVLGSKPQYAVSRDGRFLLNTAIESTSAPIIVSVNWMKKVTK
jgi:serine/threonine protein kinase